MKRTMKMMLGLVVMLQLGACHQLPKEQEMNTTTTTTTTNESQVSTSEQVTERKNVEHGTIDANSTTLSKEDQDEIIGVYERLQQALVDRDMNTLNSLLPDDFIAVHITGRRQTKEEWLGDIASRSMRYFEFTDMHYEFSQEGDQVHLKIRQRIRANIYGAEGTWSIPGTRIFEKRDGKWMIVG